MNCGCCSHCTAQYSGRSIPCGANCLATSSCNINTSCNWPLRAVTAVAVVQVDGGAGQVLLRIYRAGQHKQEAGPQHEPAAQPSIVLLCHATGGRNLQRRPCLAVCRGRLPGGGCHCPRSGHQLPAPGLAPGATPTPAAGGGRTLSGGERVAAGRDQYHTIDSTFFLF